MVSDIKKRVLITAIIGIVLVAGFYLITSNITKYTGYSISPEKNDDFEKCLIEKDITVYINVNSDVALDSLQELKLERHLKYFEIVNCVNDNSICEENGVGIYPSWIINDRKIDKDISFQELTEYSGCRFI
ncbi:hypothetical protein HOD75_01335 [archaeon]|jgi:hypothetical protein|nr:hypothetical protein [archaeon]MBT4241521.1 hypothetical protein [archaeon]MBT4417608.1 hypothetical protein [archaeon]